MTRFCIRCGRGFAGGGGRVLCDGCAAPEAGGPAGATVAGARSFPAVEQVPAVLQSGDVLAGLYEVRGSLGEGGMARVYRVWHRGWNTELAVKTPLPQMLAQAGTKGFAAEARKWVELGLHPHIVTCFYVRMLGGIPRVFAELVPGGSLADWITDRRLYAGGPGEVEARLLDIGIQAAWGLRYAHRWLVHQDVKPANVLLTGDGVAKVTDFGLAGGPVLEVASGGGSVVVRGTGGTPAYYSPEQAEAVAQARAGALGQRSWLTRRTDVWSWAVLVLEMFTGGRTWQYGQDAPAVLEEHLAARPRPGIPAMPPALAGLLRECLQANPAARPHDFGQIAGRLAGIYRQATSGPYPRQEPRQVDLRAGSLNNRALSLLDLGQPDQAEAAWDQALKQEPYHPDTIYNQGLTRWRAGRMSDVEAVAQLEQACHANPGEWLPRYLLAQVHLERDDCQAVIDTLEAIPAPDGAREEVTTAMDTARRRLPHSARLLRTLEARHGRPRCLRCA